MDEDGYLSRDASAGDHDKGGEQADEGGAAAVNTAVDKDELTTVSPLSLVPNLGDKPNVDTHQDQTRGQIRAVITINDGTDLQTLCTLVGGYQEHSPEFYRYVLERCELEDAGLVLTTTLAYCPYIPDDVKNALMAHRSPLIRDAVQKGIDKKSTTIASHNTRRTELINFLGSARNQ